MADTFRGESQPPLDSLNQNNLRFEDISDKQLFVDISELWRNPPNNKNNNNTDDSNGSDILINEKHLTPHTLQNVLSHLFYCEMRTAEMTNLSHLLIGRSDEFQEILSNPTTSSLSLSHEQLQHLPQIICQELGSYVRTLDLSCNELRNMDFLQNFTELTSLIMDRNPIDSSVTMPWMPKLELLYLNYCYIDDIYWVDTLSYNCPHLKYLSLMGNPVAPSILNGGTKYEQLEYRMHVIATLPNLLHLDDKYITIYEKKESKKMYPKSLLDSITESSFSCMPNILRSFRMKMKDKYSLLRRKSEKNRIV